MAMAAYALIVLAHAATVTLQPTRRDCIAAAHKAEQRGQIAECVRRLPRPQISLDSDGDVR